MKSALTKEDLDREASRVDPEPSEEQKRSGIYRKGHVSWKGLPITIETAKGTYRRGVGKDGTPWKTKMRHHYGYIKRTESEADGDHLDVFLADGSRDGEDLDSEIVFIVNQNDPGTGEFDEHKIMLGFTSEKAAKAGYLANYEEGWKGCGSVSPMTLSRFKKWIHEGNTGHAVKAAEASRSPVVAVDLDGTLAKPYASFNNDKIEDPRPGARAAMRKLREAGCTIIINTVRGNTSVIKQWFMDHDIPYDYINTNPDQPDGASHKIMADLYVDDRAVDGRQAWPELTDKILARVKLSADLRSTPAQVAALYKEAKDIQQVIRKIVKRLPKPGGTAVYWNKGAKELWAELGDDVPEPTHQRWTTSLQTVPGVLHVRTSSHGPPDRENWVRVKGANTLRPSINPYNPFELAGAPTGGSTPLSNAIVGGLLGGGLGYGGGWLLNKLLPNRFFDEDDSSLPLLGGLAGAAIGGAPGLYQASLNADISTDAGRPLSYFRGLITPNNRIPVSPDEFAWRDGLLRQQRPAADSSNLFLKTAAKFAAGMGMETGNAELRPVPVDAFNQAIWNDVHNGIYSSRYNPYGTRDVHDPDAASRPLHTPPVVGAAATGLVSGIQQMYGGAPILHPSHFVNGLIAAGVDYATARVAGGTLGMLGGLRPEAQQTLQNMGLWGGLIRGVTGSVLGLQ